ncbi:universal stress protein [Pedobacter psychroterrae]|uniref:Universal stress protein n=1 Tax=Pedobacter psychroterrae TaxID=2530453 RepID=A0A4V2MLD3_9SPHI|nr:universal stress protein [Pedobacter psychroterrae]TCD01507.1 universal stress protein [Pedobacter psychroterrae]
MEFHKILIAIDNNPSAERIAMNGLQLARQLNAEVALVSIVDPDDPTDQDPPTPRELDDMMEHNLNRSQLAVIENVFKTFPVKSFVKTGTPYKVILETAERWGANIIVMGTHGRKGLPHLLLGSVAEDVIRHSKKTVIVIPVTS